MQKINEKIESIFAEKNIVGENGNKVPVVFANYTGIEEKVPPSYIVYTDTGEPQVLMHGDGVVMVQRCQYDFMVYTQKRYFSIVQQLTNILKEAGFKEVSEGVDGFDNQLKYYFKRLSFSILCNGNGDVINGRF